MTLAKNRVRRIAVVGALAAAVALPALAALSASTTQTTDTATGNCLAWFGSRDDGQCLSYSNGQGGSIGTPGLPWGLEHQRRSWCVDRPADAGSDDQHSSGLEAIAHI